jgi:hypothetical protein
MVKNIASRETSPAISPSRKE